MGRRYVTAGLDDEGRKHQAEPSRQITEGKDKGKRQGEDDETENSRAAKKLLFVVFHPMVAARENGVTIPGVGIPSTPFMFLPSELC